MSYTIEYFNNGSRVAVRGPFPDAASAKWAFADWQRLTPGDTAYLCLGGKTVSKLSNVKVKS